MAKSKQGGAFGFLRGKVGGVTYSVLSGEASGTGKKEQIVRSLPESVKNPQTAGQTMQRMKLSPAQKFYSAFSELLSNAFEGISYGDASRRYFMALAMKSEGPYVQKGVDRFLPAAYIFSQGSLPSIGIEPFEGGAAKIVLANTVEEGTTTITNAEFAALLGVDEGYQLTLAVVNNVNGVFIPSYISFDNRVTIADLPEGTLSIEDGHVAISPSALGLDMSAMVACCVVLSVQDASGQWLRSTQEMVISNELRNSLYGPDALEAAIYSYQTGNTVNSVNSAWYYNLGLAQAWGGKLITVVMDMNEEGLLDDKNVVMGIKQIDGRVKRTIFATATTDEGLVIYVENGRITTNENGTVSQFRGLHMAEYNEVEQWYDSYATQLNVQTANQPSGARTAYVRPSGVVGYGDKLAVDEDGKLLMDDNKVVILNNPDGYAVISTASGSIAEHIEQILQAFGGSSAATMGALGGTSSLTLPAAGGKESRTYEIVSGVATPTIEDFNA